MAEIFGLVVFFKLVLAMDPIAVLFDGVSDSQQQH
jgi:hypothetical protein